MPDPKANILVVFYSRDGAVEALAKAVGEGARHAGAEVRLLQMSTSFSSEHFQMAVRPPSTASFAP